MIKRGRVLTIPTPLGDIELPPLPPLPFPPFPKKALGTSGNPEVAKPELTLVLAVTAWDVEVTVNINMAGVTHVAEAGEAEVRIMDTGELLAAVTVYNQTPWRATDATGKAKFLNSEFPAWLGGYDGTWGPNRFSIEARLAADPTVVADVPILLGVASWDYEG